jgi:hypothetical protein
MPGCSLSLATASAASPLRSLELLHESGVNDLGTGARDPPESGGVLRTKPARGLGPFPVSRPSPLGRKPDGQRGGKGIRTLEGLAPLAVFKTAAFVRSAIPPGRV